MIEIKSQHMTWGWPLCEIKLLQVDYKIEIYERQTYREMSPMWGNPYKFLAPKNLKWFWCKKGEWLKMHYKIP